MDMLFEYALGVSTGFVFALGLLGYLQKRRGTVVLNIPRADADEFNSNPDKYTTYFVENHLRPIFVDTQKETAT